ncbi:hypothetical protein E2320_006336 [Naja naja]|nr:hypothetical protein E2320_006336 [Naja naja]
MEDLAPIPTIMRRSAGPALWGRWEGGERAVPQRSHHHRKPLPRAELQQLARGEEDVVEDLDVSDGDRWMDRLGV